MSATRQNEEHPGHASLHEVDDDWREAAPLHPHVGPVVDADAGEYAANSAIRPEKDGAGAAQPLVHALDTPGRATDRRQQPEHRHRAPFREADGHQSMRRMVATSCAAERLRSVTRSRASYEDRNHQHEHRRCHDRQHVAPGPGNADAQRDGAKLNPISSEPLSPMKIDAGAQAVREETGCGAEQQREVARAGKRLARTIPAADRQSAAPTMSAMPAQRPSMLFSRLNAFVMPTTQTSVSSMSSVTESTQ